MEHIFVRALQGQRKWIMARGEANLVLQNLEDLSIIFRSVPIKVSETFQSGNMNV